MHHVILESPLNLPFLMFDAMRNALSRSKAPLPYGMALTVIFREDGVSFDGLFVSCHTLTPTTTTLLGGWDL